MAATFTDNSVPIGGFTVDVKSGTPTTGTGTPVATYVAESCSFSRPTTKVRRANEIGQYNGSALVDMEPEGTLTLQLASGTTAIPATGNWFKFDFTHAASPSYEYFVIHSVGQPYAQLDYRKVNVSFYKITTPSS
jgi:hypothetical protein